MPTGSPPAEDVIGTTEVTVKFVNKESLSNGNPVRFVLEIKVLIEVDVATELNSIAFVPVGFDE